MVAKLKAWINLALQPPELIAFSWFKGSAHRVVFLAYLGPGGLLSH